MTSTDFRLTAEQIREIIAAEIAAQVRLVLGADTDIDLVGEIAVVAANDVYQALDQRELLSDRGRAIVECGWDEQADIGRH